MPFRANGLFSFVLTAFAVILAAIKNQPAAVRRSVKKFVLFALLGLGFMSSAMAAQDEAEVISRIKLVGEVCVQGKPCSVKTPVVAAAAAPAPGAAPRSGEEIFKAVCSGCHGAGVMGAPKFGTADWAPRVAKGKATLYQHALGGFNMMPAKGGCAVCSEQEIKNGVDYMAK